MPGISVSKICVPFGGGGGINWSSYWKTQSLFFLDGTILDVAGTKYFKDTSTNGRNFLITGYDFASDWTTGFPYKSAATISAPAADAALIAADINNFLYDGDGTPNQIPVVSLFQDIDYEHKIFCKHEAQVVDSNGVETYEPRVSHIFMATAVLSGADLTKAYVDFGVTAESATAVWVSYATGNDTTGDGTKAKPYKTINKAVTAVTDGRTIYVKSVLDDIGHPSLFYIYMAADNNIVALGRCVSKATAANYGFRLSGATVDGAMGMVVLPTQAATDTFHADGNVSENIYANYCISPVAATNYSIAKFNEFKRNIFIGPAANGLLLRQKSGGVFSDNYIDIDCETVPGYGFYIEYNDPMSFNNNKIKGTYKNYVINKYGTGEFNLIGNNLRNVVYVGNAFYCANDSGDIIIRGNQIACSPSARYFAVHVAGMLTNLLSVINNKFYGGTGVVGDAIYAGNSNVVISGNLIDGHLNTSNQSLDIDVLPTTNAAKTFQVNGNKILSNRTAQYHIRCGTEGTSVANDSMTGNIYDNYVRGSGFYLNTNYGTCHGIFLGYQKDNGVYRNFCNGLSYGIIIKGSATSTKGAYYNIIRNCYQGIYSKGASGINISNNTIFNNADSTAPAYGINLGVNAVGDEPTGCVIKNNILICLLAGDYKAITIDDADNDIDYNLYYCPNGTLKFSYEGADKTFAEWQALGFDTHSIVLTAGQYAGLFADAANDDFSLPTGSVAIGFGETLNAAYDDGLDASTDWGSDTEVPTVVTKQQGAAWDCGAYVH